MLEGAFNFRDVGPLPLEDGGRVRAGYLHRSDTLQALTADDSRDPDRRCGIRTVIDLRLETELRNEGRGPLAERDEVRFVHSPLGMASIDGMPPDEVLHRLYESCLDSPSLPKAVVAVAEGARQPLLVHCAAGKDRTGVVVAVVLRLLGVAEDAVVDDYLRSAVAMPRMVERFQTWPRYREHLAAMPSAVYRVDEGPIRHLLSLLRRRGGAETWALRNGVAPATLKQLRSRLVERG